MNYFIISPKIAVPLLWWNLFHVFCKFQKCLLILMMLWHVPTFTSFRYLNNTRPSVKDNYCIRHVFNKSLLSTQCMYIIVSITLCSEQIQNVIKKQYLHFGKKYLSGVNFNLIYDYFTHKKVTSKRLLPKSVSWPCM